MKNYLFSHRYKVISGWIFYIAIIVGLYLFFTDSFDDLLVVPVPNLFDTSTIFSNGDGPVTNGILDELLTILIIVSGLVHCFSKEKVEDELISKIRLDSLTWSLYVNYALVILATVLLYDFVYFNVLIFNLFTILLFFNIKLRYNLNKHYKS
ncbi:MAG: hypothetical protein HKN89_04100 [Eudoraea sp.]|nr:hypothetical protein [Eudoraea sp.]